MPRIHLFFFIGDTHCEKDPKNHKTRKLYVSYLIANHFFPSFFLPFFQVKCPCCTWLEADGFILVLVVYGSRGTRESQKNYLGVNND